VKEGYVEIVDKFYSTIPYKTGFSKVMDNFVENLEIMNTPLNSNEEKKKPNAALDIKIEDLDLSARAYNCMVMNDIKTLGDLIKWNKKDLLGLRNLGRGTLNELDQIVDYYGLSFNRKG
jgi:DNA-directed RNA polymerase subunit alpha